MRAPYSPSLCQAYCPTFGSAARGANGGTNKSPESRSRAGLLKQAKCKIQCTYHRAVGISCSPASNKKTPPNTQSKSYPQIAKHCKPSADSTRNFFKILKYSLQLTIFLRISGEKMLSARFLRYSPQATEQIAIKKHIGI